jgi:hypothetical protein
MHYVCFHYEFEHDPADPDDDCGVPGCPSAPAARNRERLLQVVRELLDDWSDGPPANWDNHALPDYLEAFAAWLADSDCYYAQSKAPVPWDSWQVVATALRAAKADE